MATPRVFLPWAVVTRVDLLAGGTANDCLGMDRTSRETFDLNGRKPNTIVLFQQQGGRQEGAGLPT